MKRALLILLVFLAAVGARADEQILAAQQQLKDQGFYYGEVDGQRSPDTTAAIRRYQIRTGLEVTGALNQETLSSLKAGGAARPAAPAARTAPDPNVSKADHEFLQQQAAQTPTPAPPQRQRYVGTAAPAPAVADEPPRGPDYGAFYARTPYETAPQEVQVETLRRAQEKLFHFGYYLDAVDGLPGPATERSLFQFQQNAGINRTGRLDMDTLAALRLLPGRDEMFAPRPRAFYGQPLRGIWVH